MALYIKLGKWPKQKIIIRFFRIAAGGNNGPSLLLWKTGAMYVFIYRYNPYYYVFYNKTMFRIIRTTKLYKSFWGKKYQVRVNENISVKI